MSRPTPPPDKELAPQGDGQHIYSLQREAHKFFENFFLSGVNVTFDNDSQVHITGEKKDEDDLQDKDWH